MTPATDTPAPVPGACASAAASITLPAPLTLTATTSGWQVAGPGGTATAWGQTYAMTFPSVPGAVTFFPRLWAAVLPCEADRNDFDPGAVADDLIRFDGAGTVSAAGLSFPVVKVPDPSVLGVAARGGEWLLTVGGLQAEWYDRDPRRHALPRVYAGVSDRGAFLLAEDVPPLVPALSHSYDLWAVGGHPLPWRNRYAAQFWLWYRCDVADGETLLPVESAAALDLDRPVTTDGTPVRTPISRGTTLLRRLDGTTTVFLAGLVTAEVRHQFALRNALVSTKSPAYVLVTGGLLDARSVRGGEAVVPLPVLGWAPFLPDPYVSNTILTGPAVRDDVAVREVMVARIRWTTPDAVTVSFDGSLGTSLAVERAAPSDGDPRPARRNQEGPAILTQTQQHTAHPDPAGQAAVKKARAAADRVVRSLVGPAREQDDASLCASGRDVAGDRGLAAGPAAARRLHQPGPARRRASQRAGRRSAPVRTRVHRSPTWIRDRRVEPARGHPAAGAVGAGADVGRRPGHHDDGLVPDPARLGDRRRRDPYRRPFAEADAGHPRRRPGGHLRRLP